MTVPLRHAGCAMTSTVTDLRSVPGRHDGFVALGNADAEATSPLTREAFSRMAAAATVATCILPADGFLIGFAAGDDYDGGHFRWFRERYDAFLYIDRIVIADHRRRHGLGRRLYDDLLARAATLGLPCIACEVNLVPPNPVSDRFHASFGFAEVGRATFASGTSTGGMGAEAGSSLKTVRYLMRSTVA